MLLEYILTIDTEPKELVLALYENEIKNMRSNWKMIGRIMYLIERQKSFGVFCTLV
ncbi:hypothetical protein AB1K84_13480 [Mesobacillus foraminis]|uniref:hypothetical protein n=1 Tax=Mesobacillus foraminis TaxID=279826 RepID=UPI00399F93F1